MSTFNNMNREEAPQSENNPIREQDAVSESLKS